MSTDYSKMSDFEINKCVALIVNPALAEMECYDISSRAVFHDKSGTCGFSFISDPADAWPIIVGNKISIVSLDNKWIAAPVDTVIDGITGDSEVCFYASYDAVSDVSPLRAAMIVFLMMQESKNAS